MSENARKMSENMPRTCPKTLEKHDKISLPAVPGIEPGTLRIRLRGWIRVPAHWANPVTRQRVSRAFLCTRIRQKHAPESSRGRKGGLGFFVAQKSTFPKMVKKHMLSCETSLKKSKKHCTRAHQNPQVSIFTPKMFQVAFSSGSRGSRGSSGSSGSAGSGGIGCCSDPP